MGLCADELCDTLRSCHGTQRLMRCNGNLEILKDLVFDILNNKYLHI